MHRFTFLYFIGRIAQNKLVTLYVNKYYHEVFGEILFPSYLSLLKRYSQYFLYFLIKKNHNVQSP